MSETATVTARDQAIELVAATVGVGAAPHHAARTAIDTLLAHPEVLRALAGVQVGKFSYADPRADRDHMAIYRDFWQALVETDGQLDLDKVARELSDYSFIIDQLPLVYDEITGGRMSKHMYFARDVIAEANERIQELVEEAVAEAREEWRDEVEQLRQQRAAVLGFLDDVSREEWASKVLIAVAIRKAYGIGPS